MRNYTGLIPRYLRKQKKRTIMTLIGLILAVAMSAIPGIMKASGQYNAIEGTKELHGSYHAVFNNLTSDKADILKNHTDVDKAGEFAVLGTYAIPGKDFTITALYCDDAALKIYKDAPILSMLLLSGRMPDKSNEIALEQWIINELPSKPSIGDKISFNFINNAPGNSKSTAREVKAQFTLIGIIKDTYYTKFSGNSRAFISKSDITILLPKASQLFSICTQFKSSLRITDTAQKIAKDLSYTEDLQYNQNLVWSEQYSDENDWIALFLLGFMLVIATVSIYNVFNISVLERVRQFGLLRSIGTTPKQIRRIVFGEALFLCTVSIPLGLAAGIALAVVSSKSFSLLHSVGTHIIVPPGSLLLASSVCLASVFISAIIPAYTAGKVSPLEAINNNMRVLKESRTSQKKWHGLIRILLGIGGKMAYQNLWRQKKRFFATVSSMCLGIISFIVCSYYVSSANPAKMMDYTFVGDYMIRSQKLNEVKKYTPDEAQKDILGIKGVDWIYKTLITYDKILYSESEINPDYKKYIEGKYKSPIENDKETGRIAVFSSVMGYSDKALEMAEKYLTNGEVNVKKMSEVPEVLYVNNTTYGADKRMKPGKLKPGDYIYVRTAHLNIQKTDLEFGDVQKFKIAGVLDSLPIKGYFGQDAGIIIYHESMYSKYINPFFTQFDIKVDPAGDRDKIEIKLKEIDKKLSDKGLMSYVQEIENNKKIVSQVAQISYIVIIVVSLIGVFSIVSIINTSLFMRLREFGLLRAVGMTAGQLKQMIISEGLFLGLISALCGTIIGNLLAYILYLIARSDKMSYLVWTIPWQAIIIAFTGNIIIGILATFHPLRRISGLNIIESIRAID